MKMLSNFSIFKKIILSFIFIIGATPAVKAYTGACTADNGTYNYYDNFGMITVVDPKGNQPGYLFPRAYNWNSGNRYTATCDCDPVKEKKAGVNLDIYYKASSTLSIGHTDGTLQFYKINGYLEVSTLIWIGGVLSQYVATPFHDINNESSKQSYASVSYVCGANADSYFSSGSKGLLWLYITKPFVGAIQIGNTKVIDLYSTTKPGSYSSLPMSSVWVSGQITVPQNCEVNAGQIITVDFGKIWSGDFATKGQKPNGYIAKDIKASMKCNNVNA